MRFVAWAAPALLLGAFAAEARTVRAPLDVWDGDTFTLTLPSPRGEPKPERLRVRPTSYDAAERDEPCAYGRRMDALATAALAQLLAEARVVEVAPTGRKSWGRALAVVTVDGRELGAIMVDELGLARPYRRGLPGWCEGR